MKGGHPDTYRMVCSPTGSQGHGQVWERDGGAMEMAPNMRIISVDCSLTASARHRLGICARAESREWKVSPSSLCCRPGEHGTTRRQSQGGGGSGKWKEMGSELVEYLWIFHKHTLQIYEHSARILRRYGAQGTLQR